MRCTPLKIVLIASAAAFSLACVGCTPAANDAVSDGSVSNVSAAENEGVGSSAADATLFLLDSADYSKWEAATKYLVPITLGDYVDCLAPSWKEREHGPHYAPAIKVFVNPQAAQHIRDNLPGPLPLGATIVKEKWSAKIDGKELSRYAYAAMIKREAGYDPDHGDWEYVYAELDSEESKLESQRGKLQNCVECHSKAVRSDYLFRTYLTFEPAAGEKSE